MYGEVLPVSVVFSTVVRINLCYYYMEVPQNLMDKWDGSQLLG